MSKHVNPNDKGNLYDFKKTNGIMVGRVVSDRVMTTQRVKSDGVNQVGLDVVLLDNKAKAPAAAGQNTHGIVLQETGEYGGITLPCGDIVTSYDAGEFLTVVTSGEVAVEIDPTTASTFKIGLPVQCNHTAKKWELATLTAGQVAKYVVSGTPESGGSKIPVIINNVVVK